MAELMLKLTSLNNHTLEVKKMDNDRVYIYITHSSRCGDEQKAVLQTTAQELFEFGSLLLQFVG